ncbi:hypothetical protein CP976_34810 [Streptomyces coeruleorubidus]|uniref:Uncharacterized protein n=1 Tax=Streptomyces coeruleorubidus TaxID=116188 RepID=A0A5J6IC38_STRC4|nr:hypothetical protein CP976_34810 [Streptomyces coeruleorubidus]
MQPQGYVRGSGGDGGAQTLYERGVVRHDPQPTPALRRLGRRSASSRVPAITLAYYARFMPAEAGSKERTAMDGLPGRQGPRTC